MSSCQVRPGYRLVAAIAVGACVSSAAAVEGQGIPWGPATVYPAISSSLSYDDNYFRTEKDELQTWVATVSPVVEVVSRGRLSEYMVRYEAELGRPFDHDPGDYDDHALTAVASWSLTRKLDATVTANYARDHDEIGTERTEGGAGQDAFEDFDPDEYRDAALSALFEYGSEGAQGALEFEFGYRDRKYLTNRSFTFARDFEDAFARGAFFWRVAPKTRLFVESQFTDIDYDETGPGQNDLDSNEYRYSVGADWQATGKTSGRAQIGYLEKEFDDGGRDKTGTLSWLVAATYNPRTYSTVDLYTQRRTEEADNTFTEDFIVSQEIGLSWLHDWNFRTATEVAVSYRDEDFRGGSDRNDDVYRLRAQVNHALQRWLALALGFQYEEQDSSQQFFDHTRNQLFVTVSAAL